MLILNPQMMAPFAFAHLFLVTHLRIGLIQGMMSVSSQVVSAVYNNSRWGEQS